MGGGGGGLVKSILSSNIELIMACAWGSFEVQARKGFPSQRHYIMEYCLCCIDIACGPLLLFEGTFLHKSMGPSTKASTLSPVALKP